MTPWSAWLQSLAVFESRTAKCISAQCLVIELLGGEVAELILHPDCPSLGAKHDQVEANAFAKVAVAASPAVAALIAYCEGGGGGANPVKH
jgi:hypothetical protein